MRPRALVTGAAGFIGSHVAEYCATAIGLDVVGVDDLSGGFEANFEPTRRLGGRLVIGNVLDDKFMRHLFAKYGPFDYVYHLAAYAAEGLSHFIRRYNYENNLVASATVLNCALRQGEEGHRVRRFVFTSSIAAYGSTPVLPMIETTPKTPEDPYGIAKLAFEFDLVAAKRVFPELIDYTIFRPHNVYGPRQNLADKFRNAVAIFINQIMRHQPITIYGDGRQTRAFSYIDDVAPVIAASVLVDAAENEDFFVGTDNATSVNNLAALVARAMGTPDHQIVHLDARKEVVHAHASNAKMRCAFAPAQPVTLAEGLASTVQNFRAHGASEPTGYLSIEVASHLPPTWARWLAHVARRHHAAASCAGDCADDRCMGDHVIKAESDCPVPIVLNSRKPAVLFIVPGFGGMPARREVVAHNLELLQAQTIDLRCIVYVYNDEGASNARQNFKHVCDIVGPARGSWVDFASRVPKHSIRDSDFVCLGIDDVRLDASVNLPKLFNLMRWNCVDIAAPACKGSGHPVMQPKPLNSQQNVVGRRTEAVEIQFTVFTVAQYTCFVNLVTTLFAFDPDTHASTSFDQYLRNWCNASVGIVDTMIVHHLASATGYLQEEFKKKIKFNTARNATYGGRGVETFMKAQGVPKIGRQGGFQEHCGILREGMPPGPPQP